MHATLSTVNESISKIRADSEKSPKIKYPCLVVITGIKIIMVIFECIESISHDKNVLFISLEDVYITALKVNYSILINILISKVIKLGNA